MINIYVSNPTSSMTFYPEESFVGVQRGQRIQALLETTHSLDLSKAKFPVDIITTIIKGDEIPVVAQYHSGSGAPDKSGQYTYKLEEQVQGQATWGQANFKFSSSGSAAAGQVWSNVEGISSLRYIDEGRLFIHGIDDPTFTKYVTDNEDGAYTTYYG